MMSKEKFTNYQKAEPEKHNEPPKKKTTERKELKMMKVAHTASVYVRSEPSQDSDPVKILTEGTKVTIDREVNDEWSAISGNNFAGFIMARYIEVI